MAAGESAEITTATDNKSEGRFIGELHSVSVRTQRPSRENSARAEKFHSASAERLLSPARHLADLFQARALLRVDLTEPTDALNDSPECALSEGTARSLDSNVESPIWGSHALKKCRVGSSAIGLRFGQAIA